MYNRSFVFLERNMFLRIFHGPSYVIGQISFLHLEDPCNNIATEMQNDKMLTKLTLFSGINFFRYFDIWGQMTIRYRPWIKIEPNDEFEKFK